MLEALRILTDNAGMPVFRELLAVGGNACKRGGEKSGKREGGERGKKISGELLAEGGNARLLAEGGNASKRAKI